MNIGDYQYRVFKGNAHEECNKLGNYCVCARVGTTHPSFDFSLFFIRFLIAPRRRLEMEISKHSFSGCFEKKLTLHLTKSVCSEVPTPAKMRSRPQ